MEDTLFAKTHAASVDLGHLLADHKGQNVVVLDVTRLNTWTDYFVIATVTSSAHLGGLQRHIKDFIGDKGLSPVHNQKKVARDDEWTLIDLGPVVVHLMTAASREFYDLERLWADAEILWRSE